MGRKKAVAAGDGDPESAVPIEDAMQELGQIVARLETGQESLDESLRQFERGMVLLRRCQQQLDAAAQRIEIVTRMSDTGEIETSDFDGTATIQRKQRAGSSDPTGDDESDQSAGSLF